MCEFCLKHGEGEKWYLRTKNYSEELLSDVRRRKFIEEFANPEALAGGVEGVDRLEKAPSLLRWLLSRVTTRRMKKNHFGQVVPIEDIERIFSFTNTITSVACVFRHVNLGQEKRYCYGISLSPNGGKLA